MAQGTKGDQNRPKSSANTSRGQTTAASSMMRVAIAGTGGLALALARTLVDQTSHQFVLLSRSPKPQLQYYGYQIQVVDYNDAASVQHALMGVDTVLSTITGPEQLKLIDAAVHNRVRRFAPAEYEGSIGQRVIPDPIRPNSTDARTRLDYYTGYIESTVFVCGILYEHFAPGGLAAYKMGESTGISAEGSFIADVRNSTMTVPAWDHTNNPSTLCITSTEDVARFVVASLDLDVWPAEMTMCGQRMTVMDLCQEIQQLAGRPFNADYQAAANLDYQLSSTPPNPATLRLKYLLATAQCRYDYMTCYLNEQFPHIRPESFRTWFLNRWANA